MVKIQMSVEVSREYPTGKSSEYLWMDGQPWPIPREDDSKVICIEAFGLELDKVGKFAGGQTLREHGEEGKVTCRTWYLQEARYVSEQMRIFYP